MARRGGPFADCFHWLTAMRDGSLVAEYPGDGGQHAFSADVDAGQVAAVVLLPADAHLRQVTVEVPVGAEGVFLRRHATLVNPEDGVSQRAPTIHGAGWRYPDGTGVYTFVFADGQVVVSGNLNAV